MRLIATILFLIFQSTGFCEQDTTFHSPSEFQISYVEPFPYQAKYTFKDSDSTFDGWMIESSFRNNYLVFRVRNGYRDGFLLRYEQKKNKLFLTSINIYHNHECYIIAFLSFKKSEQACLSQLVFENPYHNSQDTLVSKSILFSEKDTTYSEIRVYKNPKKSASDKEKYKFKSVSSSNVSQDDMNCFHAFSNAITYLPQVLESIDQLNYPKYYLKFACGIDYVPVFKEYAPESE